MQRASIHPMVGPALTGRRLRFFASRCADGARAIARRWRVTTWPVPSPYTTCVIGGLVIGLSFGDLAFPNLATALGDPLADILLGLFGGLCAVIACEIAGEVQAMFLQLRRREPP